MWFSMGWDGINYRVLVSPQQTQQTFTTKEILVLRMSNTVVVVVVVVVADAIWSSIGQALVR